MYEDICKHIPKYYRSFILIILEIKCCTVEIDLKKVIGAFLS